MGWHPGGIFFWVVGPIILIEDVLIFYFFPPPPPRLSRKYRTALAPWPGRIVYIQIKFCYKDADWSVAKGVLTEHVRAASPSTNQIASFKSMFGSMMADEKKTNMKFV